MLPLTCLDLSEWHTALASYDQCVRSLNNEKLFSLDKWYREELPELIHSRTTPLISHAELKKLMEWKLSRGKWRPALMKYISALSENQVEEASRQAFAALPELKHAVTHLCVLKGVGPATASAVLAAYAPHQAPFMSDEAMTCALGNAKDYTLKQYLLLAELLDGKSKALNKQEADVPEEERFVWTPSHVERAIWASYIDKKESEKSEMETSGSPGRGRPKDGKRKR